MKTLPLLFLILFASACGSIKAMMKKSEAHQKMSTRLEQEGFDLPLPELKARVIASLSSSDSGPMIMMPMDASEFGGNLEKQQRAREALEEALDDQGFSYNKKMYKNELDVNWLGLWNSTGKETESLKNQLFTGPYHLIEDQKDLFMVVKGIHVYKGELLPNNRSRLTVLELKELKRDPMQVKLAWFQILKTRQLWFSLNEGPVSMEKTLQTAKRDRLRELTVLHHVDQNRFAAWEAEALR